MQRKWLTVGALAACWAVSELNASELKPVAKQQAATDHLVVVQDVDGAAEYSYRGFPWQRLHPGKILKAGATVRTTPESSITLKMGDYENLVRVAPATSLELVPIAATKEKPAQKNVVLGQGMARVRSLRGKASVFQNGAWHPVNVNSVVAPGATVYTERKTQLDLFFPREGLVVRMKPKTVMSLKEGSSTDAKKLQLAVARGRVEMNKPDSFLADGK